MARVDLLIIGAGALVLLLLFRNGAAGAGQTVGGAVVDAGAGFVIGIGSGLGIPNTDSVQCEDDIAAGRTWDASFSCPASRWLKSWMSE